MHFSPQPFNVDWREKDHGLRHSYPADKNVSEDRAGALDVRLARAVGGHVAWLMKHGGDVQPQASAGLDTPFLQAWRQLEEKPLSTPAQINVGRYFISAIDLHLAGIQSSHQAYQATVDYIEAGDIQNLGIKERCLATGAEVEYGFAKWLCVPTPDRTRRPGLFP